MGGAEAGARRLELVALPLGAGLGREMRPRTARPRMAASPLPPLLLPPKRERAECGEAGLRGEHGLRGERGLRGE